MSTIWCPHSHIPLFASQHVPDALQAEMAPLVVEGVDRGEESADLLGI